MSRNIIIFCVQQAMVTKVGMTTSAQFIEQAKIWHPKNFNFNGKLWPNLSTLLENCVLYKMVDVQQFAQEKTYRDTYDWYPIINADLSNDNMEEMSVSPLSENFDCPSSNKGFRQPGKEINSLLSHLRLCFQHSF